MRKILTKLFMSVAVFAMVLNLAWPTAIASATSIYDDAVDVPAYWKVVDSFGVSHDTNIEEAIQNVSNTQDREVCEEAYASFSQKDYRAFLVIKPSSGSPETYVQAYATNQKPGETEWFADSVVANAGVAWYNSVIFQLKYQNGNVVAFDCNDHTGTDQYRYVVYVLSFHNNSNAGHQTYYTEGFQIDYPNGYDGDSIPFGSRTGLITGNVWCSNTNNLASAVHIDANSGMDGNAQIIENLIEGGVDYKYYLSEESPYHLVVMCDGNPFYGPTVDVLLYIPKYWECVTIVNQDYCAAR